jgi:hypothetical protein
MTCISKLNGCIHGPSRPVLLYNIYIYIIIVLVQAGRLGVD